MSFNISDRVSKERWIYCTAELHEMSVEQVRDLFNKCDLKYGNILTFRQKLKYVRNIIRKESPLRCFQFDGKVWDSEKEWLPHIPEWFRQYVNHNSDIHIFENTYREHKELKTVGKIILAPRGKDIVRFGDYVVDFPGRGLYGVPQYFLIDGETPTEISLYEYLVFSWSDYMQYC